MRNKTKRIFYEIKETKTVTQKAYIDTTSSYTQMYDSLQKAFIVLGLDCSAKLLIHID